MPLSYSCYTNLGRFVLCIAAPQFEISYLSVTILIGRTHTENHCSNDLSENLISWKGPSFNWLPAPTILNHGRNKNSSGCPALSQHSTGPCHGIKGHQGYMLPNLKHRLLCWGKNKGEKNKRKKKRKSSSSPRGSRAEVSSKKCAELTSSQQLSH